MAQQIQNRNCNSGRPAGTYTAEIAAVEADALAYGYMIDNIAIFESEFHERTRYMDLLANGEPGTPLGDLPGLPTLPVPPASVEAGIFKRVSNMVARIKLNKNYNEALGQNLGIIGAERVIDYENLKVHITLRHTNNDGVALDFVKGQMDGVVVYGGVFAQKIVQPADSAATTSVPPVMKWTEIGRATKSPYVDRRLNDSDLPETRYYKMCYMKDDATAGKDSDTISVVAVVFEAGNETATKLK